MILVIPLSASDVKLAPDLSAALTHLGPYRAHECVIMPTRAVQGEAETLKNQLVEIFGSVAVVPMNYNGEGWPLAPNRHFREAAQWIQNNRPGSPWYFFEADNTPIKKGWLNSIEAAYQSSGKLYMGAIVPTRVSRTTSAGLEHGTDGSHMVGTGVYPWNAWGRSIILATCDQRYVWATEPMKPFDVQMALEIVPFAAHTELIAHRWRTVNYRYSGTRLICDDQPGNPPGTSHAGPIPDAAVVVHGCRDGSLARLVVSSDTKAVEVPVTQPVETGPTPFEQWAAKRAAQPPVAEITLPDRETPPWRPLEPVETPLPAATPTELSERIRAAIQAKGKRPKALAEELKVKTGQVRRAVLKPNSGMRLVGGWVKMNNQSTPSV